MSRLARNLLTAATLLSVAVVVPVPRPRAEPPEGPRVEEGALDAAPAPRAEPRAADAPAPATAELPPAARAGAFRAASRPPAAVPPAAVVRSAKRPGKGRAAGATGARPAESSPVQIIWRALGSGP